MTKLFKLISHLITSMQEKFLKDEKRKFNCVSSLKNSMFSVWQMIICRKWGKGYESEGRKKEMRQIWPSSFPSLFFSSHLFLFCVFLLDLRWGQKIRWIIRPVVGHLSYANNLVFFLSLLPCFFFSFSFDPCFQKIFFLFSSSFFAFHKR